uniref:Type Ib crustin cruIb-1 n=1 Tax=Penaeus vannamei TaxID=6689 RepID=A0A7L9R3K6_PENVA|nr:type Ib crustin cruIb-1 [Penaeus vannamei]
MRVIVLALLVAASSACRYYCKTLSDETYCCDGGKDYNPPEYHDGNCPKVRSFCPRIEGGSRRPDVCPHDGACQPYEKCCFDTCLDHHTCKLADEPSSTATPTLTTPTTKPPYVIANFARNKVHRGG